MGVNRAPKSYYRSPRWKAVRLQAKRRDGFRCRHCGASGKLEVHHLKRVMTHPELCYDLDNLLTLCVSCHSKETAKEVGLAPLSPDRQKWRDFLDAGMRHRPVDGDKSNA